MRQDMLKVTDTALVPLGPEDWDLFKLFIASLQEAYCDLNRNPLQTRFTTKEEAHNSRYVNQVNDLVDRSKQFWLKKDWTLFLPAALPSNPNGKDLGCTVCMEELADPEKVLLSFHVILPTFSPRLHSAMARRTVGLPHLRN
ncbi:zinc ion binding [Puccinia graminis f. sp. tritici]|uniref:Zinc ion binding n=1 Tax=Puccinia graminis f. sp. tritici TaxID=56615 RepID=A0A5B0S4V3_PUCGR|nr:zinc ion binding [Puccinia graminis f. sp. tritici]